MSKCQKNKYFNVGCQPTKHENKEFQQSFATLMAAREAQDSFLQNSSASASSASASAPVQKQPQTVSLQKPLQKPLQKQLQKQLQKFDIDLILEGDI
jgi:GH25 family lysozyme M1 (1,4-beta-N-acetylmuramidase)